MTDAHFAYPSHVPLTDHHAHYDPGRLLSLSQNHVLIKRGQLWQVDMDMDAVVQLAATNPSKIPPLPPRLVRSSTRFDQSHSW